MPSRHTSRHTLSPITKLGLSYLRKSWWRQRFARPVVLLLRALYGHPEAGGLWEQHLEVVLRSMGGEEVQEYPGNFWFPAQCLLLSTYVDDLTLSSPQEEHQAFWAQLTSLVDVEPPEPVYRVLGRNHYIINAPAEGMLLHLIWLTTPHRPSIFI